MRPLIALIFALVLSLPAAAQDAPPVRVGRIGLSTSGSGLWMITVQHPGGATMQIDCEAGGTRTRIDRFPVRNVTSSEARFFERQPCPDGGQIHVGLARWTGSDPAVGPLTWSGPWPVPFAGPDVGPLVDSTYTLSLPLVRR